MPGYSRRFEFNGVITGKSKKEGSYCPVSGTGQQIMVTMGLYDVKRAGVDGLVAVGECSNN